MPDIDSAIGLFWTAAAGAWGQSKGNYFDLLPFRAREANCDRAASRREAMPRELVNGSARPRRVVAFDVAAIGDRDRRAGLISRLPELARFVPGMVNEFRRRRIASPIAHSH
jgi:hypothetical protein